MTLWSGVCKLNIAWTFNYIYKILYSNSERESNKRGMLIISKMYKHFITYNFSVTETLAILDDWYIKLNVIYHISNSIYFV